MQSTRSGFNSHQIPLVWMLRYVSLGSRAISSIDLSFCTSITSLGGEQFGEGKGGVGRRGEGEQRQVCFFPPKEMLHQHSQSVEGLHVNTMAQLGEAATIKYFKRQSGVK